ncbi:LysR family transcriptional regulator [Pseudomonas nitroreducens]|uniref:LysR family transcriptional regulator n=1 Tax=Pseudomonas nitroreducens TaxID=46680 RepID=UPI0015575BAC|nr:LysR family transcriptional regulator [Pseudomonas nitroreducens]
MAQPPLHSFRVFESVARLGSLAAAERHVATGTVSQQVKALQASLGVELFEKRGRQLVLTAAMGEITEAVQALQAGVRLEEELSVGPAGRRRGVAGPAAAALHRGNRVRCGSA